MTESDVKELRDRTELMLREMERFDRLTKNIQKIVDTKVVQHRKNEEPTPRSEYLPGFYFG